MMYKKLLELLIYTALCAGLTANAQSIERITMSAGQTELLRNLTVDRISIGNPSVIEVEVLGETNEILIQALAPGRSDLRLWSEGIVKTVVVDVEAAITAQNVESISRALADIEGVFVRAIGDRILIEGSIYNDEDLRRVTQLAEVFENVVVLASKTNIDMKNVISLDVKFVEARKNILNDIGVDWDDFFNGFFFGYVENYSRNGVYALTGDIILENDIGYNGQGFLGISSRVNSVINLLSSNGYARLLAEPRLTCVSGGDCNFLAGGEVPIPVSDDGDVTVDFKQYGVLLEIQPIADSVGNISTNVSVEVSSIDPSVTVLGIPGFLTRRTVTQTNVRNGQTIILSGMVSNESSKAVEKVPLLGDIPILGELFKSRQFRDNETELLVFVTPRVISAEHEISQKSLNRYNEINEQHPDKFKYNLMD